MQTRLIVIDPLWNELCTTEESIMLAEKGLVSEMYSTWDDSLVADINSRVFAKNILYINPDVFDWSVDASELNKINNCQNIITGSTSYSWISSTDLLNAKLQNVPNYSTDAVTDWCLMMITCLLRKVPLMIKNSFKCDYAQDFVDYRGTNLKGLKVGVIGLGNMGSAIAQKCAALGMEVSYWSVDSKSNKYKYKSLDNLFVESDIVVPFFESNPDTAKLITDNHILSMKKTAVFVSMIHHDYNHDLLLKRAENNDLGGYGFEDDLPSNFMSYTGNVWAAPAYGWCTCQTLHTLMEKVVVAVCKIAVD